MKTQQLSSSVCSKCGATAEIIPELLRRITPAPAKNFGSITEKSRVEWVVKASRPTDWSVDPKAPFDVLRGICNVCAPPKRLEESNAPLSLPRGIVYQNAPAISPILTHQSPTPQAPAKTMMTTVAPIQRALLGSVDRTMKTGIHNMVTKVAPSEPVRPPVAQAQAQILGSPVKYSSTPQRAEPPSTSLLMAMPTSEIKVTPTLQNTTKTIASLTAPEPPAPPPPVAPVEPAEPVKAPYGKQLRLKQQAIAQRAAHIAQSAQDTRVAQFVEEMNEVKTEEPAEPSTPAA